MKHELNAKAVFSFNRYLVSAIIVIYFLGIWIGSYLPPINGVKFKSHQAYEAAVRDSIAKYKAGEIKVINEKWSGFDAVPSPQDTIFNDESRRHSELSPGLFQVKTPLKLTNHILPNKFRLFYFNKKTSRA